MTANQRRPGFRLPWSTEEEGSSPDGDAASTAQDSAPKASAEAAPEAPAAEPEPASAEPEKTEATQTAPAPAAPAEPATAAKPATDEPAAPAESSDEFMRDLVAAMRAVAEEARHAGVTELKAKADVQVKTLEADAEKRRGELSRASDEDIAGIGKWAETEADRIKQEAEQKVVARKARLDQELAADGSRTEAEAKAVRDRVAAYEAELEAYHAQLSQINDPAAFAAAAKRLPKPPALGGSAAAASTPAPAETPASESTDAGAREAATNGVSADPDATDADALASRLAELDATLPKAEAEGEAAAPADSAEPTAATQPEPAAPETAPAEPAPAASASTDAPAPAVAEPAADAPAKAAPTAAGVDPAVTEVVVKGLGSFGAITGFRQSLSGVDGIESVALSLGQTGEFVFRATHAPGFDVRSAIAALEGDGAKIEDRPEGGLRVTLERAR
jgi:nicotinate-nucleotide--dimethylbenzimidazole phosphoribosyltransferase